MFKAKKLTAGLAISSLFRLPQLTALKQTARDAFLQSFTMPTDAEAVAANRRAAGGYNRRRAVSVAASKRAATKRRNIAKRSKH